MSDIPTESKIAVPEGFLLGAASAAHQVEGDNMNSDWWHWESAGKLPKSGLAADHYNRYQDDFQIAHDIGLNAMRISIEWSRIEPVEGRWDSIAIEHYRKVLKNMKDQGLTRMVTLHHFTLPMWLAERGGFENPDAIQAFARFAWFVAQNLGEDIDLWLTINEPENLAILGYGESKWPPFKKNVFKVIAVYQKLIKAHKAAYKAIKEVLPNAQVGIAKNNTFFEPFREQNYLDKFVAAIPRYFKNSYFLNRIRGHMDFIGLNYYFYHTLKAGWRGYQMMNLEKPKSDMGWKTYPKGIYHLIKELAPYNVPVYITENGIANARDDMREDFISEHIHWALKAKQEGVDVKGYFYWSFTDTYEWQDGFNPKFGLVEINFETQERKIRKSAGIFKKLKQT